MDEMHPLLLFFFSSLLDDAPLIDSLGPTSSFPGYAGLPRRQPRRAVSGVETIMRTKRMRWKRVPRHQMDGCTQSKDPHDVSDPRQ